MTDAPEPGTPRTWDFLTTVALIVLTLLLAVAFAIAAVGSGVANQACSVATSNCSPTRVQVGQLICFWGPPIVALLAITWSIVRVLRRKIAFFIVVLGLIAMTAAFVAGRLILDSGIPASAA